jgi:hypothetical protein
LILVIKPFEAAHKDFEDYFIQELRCYHEVVCLNYSAGSLLTGLFLSIKESYHVSYEKVFILNTINLCIPFYSKKSSIVLHNNLERRFSIILKYYQTRCITICDAQRRILPNTQYKPHRLPEGQCRLKKKESLLALLTNKENVILGHELGALLDVSEVLFGWEGGPGFIPDLQGQLCQSKYLFIDKDYSLRASSIVAAALAAKCIVIMICKRSAYNLARTFKASLRNEMNLWLIEMK